MILKKEDCGGTDFLSSVPRKLTNIFCSGINKLGSYIVGSLGTLKIRITESRIKIFNSSICKFFYGENFSTLTKEDTRLAVEMISDSLDLPFQLAHISRIDFAHNLIMENPEFSYFSSLGESRYYDRLEQNNGLYYSNRRRQLVFYGKNHEQRIKGLPIPEEYEGQHILRFELRLKNRLCQQLQLPVIRAEMLHDELFVSNLVNYWKGEYFKIQKLNSKILKMETTGSKKRFIENLAQITVSELGQPILLSKIEEWREEGLITKKQAFDLRSFLKGICVLGGGNCGNKYIAELDRKILDAARNC